jgi:hypothetical protein
MSVNHSRKKLLIVGAIVAAAAIVVVAITVPVVLTRKKTDELEDLSQDPCQKLLKRDWVKPSQARRCLHSFPVDEEIKSNGGWFHLTSILRLTFTTIDLRRICANDCVSRVHNLPALGSIFVRQPGGHIGRI